MKGTHLCACLLATAAVSSCAPPTGDPPGSGPVPVGDRSATIVPAGHGSLRQDELAIRLQPSGLVVRAIPLEESLIRLLTPDSYRTLHDLRTSNAPALSDISRRLGERPVEPWLVSFHGVEPEVRFSPLDLIITSTGRDFRALDVIALSAGFGEQRLRQRETQTAILVFEGEMDLRQPLTVSFMTERSDHWEQILPRIERERALVRARASRTEP